MKMKINLYSTVLAAIVLFLFTLAPVVAASLTNPIGDTQVQGVGMSSSPAAIYYGKLYCFHQRSNNNGQLWYCSFDGQNWYKDAQISGVTLRGSPAVTGYNGKLYCFYQGDNDGQQLWYCSFDGQNWIQDKQVKGVGMSDSPAVIEYNGKLYCFHQGSNNNGQLWYCSFDGQNWAQGAQVQGVGMSDSPAVIEYNGKLYCFHQGSNNNGQLWYSIFDGTDWAQDTQVQGVYMSSSPAVIEYNGKLYCFYQGSNNNGQLWYSIFDGTDWAQDTQVQGVYMSSSPTVIEYNGKLYCFHQGSNNNGQLWYSIFEETIPILPVASFNISQVNGTLSVQFNDTSLGSPTSWNWDFGDGTNSDKQNPMHTYSEAGNYKVNLTVKNVGIQSSKISEINVSPTPPMNSSMSVSVSSEPESVEPDKPSTVTVTVTGTDGKGISEADVKLESDAVKISPVSGTTDSSGNFTSTFTASDTGAATIKAQVTKKGFNNASGETSVEVTKEGFNNASSETNVEVTKDETGIEIKDVLPMAAILLFALIGIVIYTKRPKPIPKPEPTPKPEPAPPKLPVETALYMIIEPESIPADGKSTAKVIIKIKDDKGNFVPSNDEKTVELSITRGTVTNQVKISLGERDGTALITSEEIAGTATVIASSSPLKEASAQVNFVSQ